MKKTQFSEFAVDNASILFLSRIYPYHTNSFRFTYTLHEEVCPKTLQKAVDRIWQRFPSVIAGFKKDFSGMCRFLHPGNLRFRQTRDCCLL